MMYTIWMKRWKDGRGTQWLWPTSRDEMVPLWVTLTIGSDSHFTEPQYIGKFGCNYQKKYKSLRGAKIALNYHLNKKLSYVPLEFIQYLEMEIREELPSVAPPADTTK